MSLKDIDAYMNTMMAAYHIPGLAVAIVQNDTVQLCKGYGLISLEFELGVDAESVFQMYSVSKVFAGIAALRLVESGLLDLDQPLAEILGMSLPHWQTLSVRHMLSHTAGLGDWAEPQQAAAESQPSPRQNTDVLHMLRHIADQPASSQPGDAFAYNQTGYALFGLLVEYLTGRSYAAWLDQELFQPLGMRSTSFGDSLAIIPRRSPVAYLWEAGRLKNTVYRFPELHYPAAGLNTSIQDVAALLDALNRGQILRAESLAVLWAPTQLRDGRLSPYGLGWSIGTYHNRHVVGHEGGGAAWLLHLPNEQLSIAVLCNLNGARADEIPYGIIDRLL